MASLFALTLFVSALLLFLVEPMVAKMVLPHLGGTPAVWNTCMVFFQAALLAGYAFAHLSTSRLRPRRQALLQLALLLLPFLVLPLAVPEAWAPPADVNPIPGLLGLLLVTVGLPFFVLASTAPLLQKWFAGTGHPAAKDPYFLYAASNLGSMLALLAYPFLLEPNLSLAAQSRLWTAGYGLLAVLMLGCAGLIWRAAGSERSWELEDAASRSAGEGPAADGPPLRTEPGRWTRLHWVLLAFVPSSLMLSVTTYLTTDIAAIPLLWVAPLALYLLSFILVFAPRPLLPHAVMGRVFPFLVLLLTIVMLSHATEPVWLLLPLHLVVFFVAAMICHGELARQRPSADRLTEFYLWLALGGVLGGLFNALVAPLIFPGVVEYPLVLVLACLLRPAPGEQESGVRSQESGVRGQEAGVRGLGADVVWAVLLGLLTAGLVIGVQARGLEHQALSVGLMFGLPAVVCYTFLYRPIRFGLGVAALLVAGAFYQGVYGGKVLHRERSFFGVHQVTWDDSGRQHLLVHGNTVHGRQNLLHPGEPLAYFHRSGPIGQVFQVFSGPAAKRNVALVGLGTGSLAAYGEPGQHMTYYEIDPAVERLASDPAYFTFLRDARARGVQLDIVLGDARRKLREAPDHCFDLMVMDAFSSDAIPLHLLTREALHLYEHKLTGDGLLTFNISNRYLDLQPVLGALAREAGLLCWAQHDLEVSPAERAEGKYPSEWVLMAHQRSHLGRLSRDGRWRLVRGRRHGTVWTDDFSNLFSVFRWK